MKLKAIETIYGGHRFRSRLEARWAILFDALGLNWEYEIEGFEFEDGTKYLPDFFIYDTNWFIEVKPDVPLSKSEINKINKLDNYPPDYAWGVGVTPKLELIKSPKVSFPNESIASSYKPNEFSAKELINGADINNWLTSSPQLFYWGFLGQSLSGDNINFINQAILKAMQARFEFGEEVDQKMDILKANEIKKFSNWTALIYAEAGKGKTTMVKTLKGRTLLLSVDGMYHVLADLENVDIVTIDSKKAHDELTNFLKYVFKHKDQYDNIVIDNLSTFQKMWLNERARETTSGNPEIQHYSIIDRIMFDTILSLKKLEKNLLVFAHEKQVEIVRQSGGTYTQFQPDIRNLDAIMGIIPIVGRLIIHRNKDTNENERIIVLQPTQATRAKDQLIGDLPTIGQMELFPALQKNI